MWEVFGKAVGKVLLVFWPYIPILPLQNWQFLQCGAGERRMEHALQVVKNPSDYLILVLNVTHAENLTD